MHELHGVPWLMDLPPQMAPPPPPDVCAMGLAMDSKFGEAPGGVDIWPKDLGIVLDIAREAKFGAPITAAALQQFLAASGSGLGKEDDAAVAKVYARNAGIKLPGEA